MLLGVFTPVVPVTSYHLGIPDKQMCIYVAKFYANGGFILYCWVCLMSMQYLLYVYLNIIFHTIVIKYSFSDSRGKH